MLDLSEDIGNPVKEKVIPVVKDDQKNHSKIVREIEDKLNQM